MRAGTGRYLFSGREAGVLVVTNTLDRRSESF